MTYECANCSEIFDNFAEANNHEKAHEYDHLTYSDFYELLASEVTECSACYLPLHAMDALWSDNDDPYCSLECERLGQGVE